MADKNMRQMAYDEYQHNQPDTGYSSQKYQHRFQVEPGFAEAHKKDDAHEECKDIGNCRELSMIVFHRSTFTARHSDSEPKSVRKCSASCTTPKPASAINWGINP